MNEEIAKAIEKLGERFSSAFSAGGTPTPGVVEYIGMMQKEGMENISSGLQDIAEALRDVAAALNDQGKP
jgi:hypothetical protein